MKRLLTIEEVVLLVGREVDVFWTALLQERGSVLSGWLRDSFTASGTDHFDGLRLGFSCLSSCYRAPPAFSLSTGAVLAVIAEADVEVVIQCWSHALAPRSSRLLGFVHHCPCQIFVSLQSTSDSRRQAR